MANYYDYSELRKASISGDADALKALGEWMIQHGSAYWNGEYYDISAEGEPSGSLTLYPVYSSEADDPKIIGWEIR